MRTKKSIIFLDFDGVLTNEVFLKKQGPVNRFTHYHGGTTFCIQNMEKLNQIISKSHAKIVVISTWRKKMHVDELKSLLYSNYCIGEVIGVTDDFPFNRGAEVLDWLLRNGEKEHVGNFVIIDDRLDFGFLQHNLCTVHEDFGITAETVYRANQILTKNDPCALTFEDIKTMFQSKTYPRNKWGRSLSAWSRIHSRKDAGYIRYVPEHRSNIITSARFASHKHLSAMHTAVDSKDYVTLKCLLDIHDPDLKRLFLEHHLNKSRENGDYYLESLLLKYHE